MVNHLGIHLKVFPQLPVDSLTNGDIGTKDKAFPSSVPIYK